MISNDAKFAQLVEALKKAEKYGEFRKKFTNLSEVSMEAKINAALSVLKDAGIVESITESGWGLTFLSQHRTPMKKNNGSGDNFVEGSPLNRDRSRTITEQDRNPYNKGDKVLREALGLPPEPKAPEGLTRLQEADYNLALRFGLKPDDALKLAKMPLRIARV